MEHTSSDPDRDHRADSNTEQLTRPGADPVTLRPDGINAALHFAGDGPESTDQVARGRVASTRGLTQGQVGEAEVVVSTIMAVPSTAILSRLVQAVVTGELQVPIQRTYPLVVLPESIE